MSFYIHGDLNTSEQVAALDRVGKGSCIALWGLAGSWASDRLTGGVVPLAALRVLGGKAASADQLVCAGLWERHPDGYEFKGATAAYNAVDMSSARRPKQYVTLLLCKLPSKAFIDWHARHNLRAYRKIPAELRAEVVRQHGMVCWLCSKPIANTKDLHLDHVKARSWSGQETADNLRPAHARCNILRGNKDAEAFKATLRGGR